MAAKVSTLASQHGITPALQKVSDQFWSDICDAIESATDQGLPAAILVGALEFAKHGVVSGHYAGPEE